MNNFYLDGFLHYNVPRTRQTNMEQAVGMACPVWACWNLECIKAEFDSDGDLTGTDIVGYQT